MSAAERIDGTLAALADPVRRRIVDVLAAGPRRAGVLADEVGISAPSMSKHLRVLRDHDLVDDHQGEFDARVRVYSLRAAPMAELRVWLDATERGWAEQLAAFAAHVER